MVRKCFGSFILQYGAPKRVISDSGSCFTSKSFTNFCQHYGILQTLIAVRHPRANDQVEQVNRVLNSQIAIIIQMKKRVRIGIYYQGAKKP